jgi:hypothetical protein
MSQTVNRLKRRSSLLQSIALTVLAVLVMLAPALSQAKPSRALMEDDAWIRYYYQDPQPEKMTDLVELMLDMNIYDRPEKFNSMLVLVYQALMKNPELAPIWVDKFADRNQNAKTFIAMALWNAKIGNAASLMADKLELPSDAIERIVSVKPYNPLEHPVATPSDLDMQWATFMVTGNEAALDRIIDFLAIPKKENVQGIDKERELIRLASASAAKWSLASNGRRDEKIALVIQRRYQSADGVLKEQLEEVNAEMNK